ncbi:alpha/beta hydrolase [Sphingomonas sp. AAP5]|uniref:alpha/beta fold hydrolase n=1 Tax=Sphingomonas sp. AAP5 TaxID=1523415 RepID=UPI0010573C2A|nr:alpha/beta hydrolase [Sphingomonas sp. AAP5]QBM75125.1 alpha/beta hydrolase [Sphingomonas sp. AAP5]
MRVVTIAIALGLATLSAAGDASPGTRPEATSYRAYVDGRWGQVHVRVAGPANGPTVVLVHKMVWSSIEFSKAQPWLAARGIRSIAVDLPGYGLSDSPAAQPSAEDYADDLLPILDHFKARKAVMVGANTGATLVTAFALRHPTRTAAVVLDGPPVFEGEAQKEALAEPEFDRTARPGGATLVARWNEIAALAKKNGGLSDEAIQTGILQFFQAGPHYLWGHQAIFSYPLRPALARLTGPVLLLTYPGDQLLNVSLEAKRDHPAFTLKEISWAGMTADYQDPKEWADALADYTLALPR